ncbi:MAG: hypothetical protein M1840_005890 [Geoglossum simile]|nr:MAG: hypothetical protein M1840_005890 [Geoglossum simile]
MAAATHVTPVTHTEDLTVLSEVISKNVHTYLARIQERGYPLPNLRDAILEPVKDLAAQDAKLEILRACEKLMALVQGPVEWLMFQNMAFSDPACVGLVMEMGIHEHIAPGPEPTTLDELVESTGASRDLIERVMRVCTQRLVFEEVGPGQYIHNGVSMSMLFPTLGSLIHHCCEDGLLSAANLIGTLRKNNFQISDDPAKSAFSAAFQTDLGMFDYYYKTDTVRGSRFAMGMAGTEAVKSLTEDVYPFHELPAGAKIVDVGGGRGQVSVRIAEKEPHLSFVVQDHATVIEAGQAEGLSEAAEKAIEWQAHDFFQAQPVKGADVYLFRFILHDHPDTACIKILRHIVDAMDPGVSRILIDDAVIPDLLGAQSMRFFNLLDMYMLMILNAKERTEKQWAELLRAVDERLVLERIWTEPDAGRQGGTVLEARLKERESLEL